jgi:hypothetical protein
MRQPRTTANRTVLTAGGLALLLGGGWLATAGTSLAHRLPDWWPDAPSGSVLLDRAELARFRDHSWWTPTVIAVSILATALLTLWFLSQLHLRTRSRLPLAAPGSAVHTRALKNALAQRARSIDGITGCRLRIHAERRHLRVTMHVWLTPGSAPAHVLGALASVTAEAQRSAVPYTLEARVRLSHRSHPMPHVR